MVRYYYPHESALRSLLRWHYTLTSSVFAMAEFWLYLTAAGGVMFLMDTGYVHLPAGVAGLDVFKLLSPQLSITIFAVVFYNNRCYSRYMSLYQTCVEIDVSAKQFVSELVIHFGDEPQLANHIVQASKYAMAGIFYFYLSMEDIEPMTDTWRVLQSKGLLTQADEDAIREYPGTVFTLLLHWSSYIVKDAVRILRPNAGAKTYTPPELSALSNRMYNMIDNMASSALRVRSIQNMPVPFSYFHLLNILISLTVFATGIGCLILVEAHDAPSYCLAFLPYSVVTFVLLALRQLSGELADPFGKDDLDFPIADFMRHIYDNVVALQTFSHHQTCPGAAADSLAACEFFIPGQIRHPCQDQKSERKEKTSWFASMLPAERRSRRSMAFKLLPEEEAAAYGPRNWVTPEDLKGGERLAKWSEGLLQDGNEKQGLSPSVVQLETKAGGPKAQLVGVPAESTTVLKEKKEEVKDQSPKPAASPAAALQDANCIDALGRIEGRMGELLACMTELAGNLKDLAQGDVKKKDAPRTTTVVKTKAKKESSAPPAQATAGENLHQET
mmetsp:Transcript_9128/g.21674  ORF Transcript_9128/g.21674 Transcript_9128/m.21674 type:complete len:557 (-) Transcript_9128:162-1832(-)